MLALGGASCVTDCGDAVLSEDEDECLASCIDEPNNTINFDGDKCVD